MGHSPPRSKKESSDVSEPEPVPTEVGPDPSRLARAAKQEAKQHARAERARRKLAAAEDRIVEAPREPKQSRSDKRRQKAASAESSAVSGRSAGLFVAGLLGAVGLTCSVVLALGALLVALGSTQGNGFFDAISPVCDVLVGPLRDTFSFTGANAESKESLVAWGAGSIGYLMVGIFLQSFLRARFSND